MGIYIKKYKVLIINLLLVIPLFISIIAIDLWVLPQKKIDDHVKIIQEHHITSRGQYSDKSRKMMGKFTYITEKGYTFSTEKRVLGFESVFLERSYLFRTISGVTSEHREISSHLVSGYTGLNLLFLGVLLFTSLLSLALLQFYTKLSENGYYNIILSNLFVLFLLIYFWNFYN